jgi:hypothetical protein
MSSVLVQDFYRPWRARRGAVAEHHYVQAGRAGMGVIGFAMFVMAVVSFYWQRYSDERPLEFALQVMVFTYAGLLGVISPRCSRGGERPDRSSHRCWWASSPCCCCNPRSRARSACRPRCSACRFLPALHWHAGGLRGLCRGAGAGRASGFEAD